MITDIDKALHKPTDTRIFVISKAFRAGYTIDQIHELTKIDRWFLQKLYGIMCTSKELHKLTMDNGQLAIKKEYRNPDNCQSSIVHSSLLRKAKRQGFSDFQIARAFGLEGNIEKGMMQIRQFRKEHGIVPVVKQIDTLAAEYPAQTNYL